MGLIKPSNTHKGNMIFVYISNADGSDPSVYELPYLQWGTLCDYVYFQYNYDNNNIENNDGYTLYDGVEPVKWNAYPIPEHMYRWVEDGGEQ